MAPPELRDSLLAIEGRVAVLTMNRPDVRNELTGTRLAEEIIQVAGWINGCDRISVLVLTGAGAAFSAGGNIRHMLEREEGSYGGDVPTVQTKYRQGLQRMARALVALEVPLIAALNGPAAGTGFDLALLCDIRLAATTAKVSESFLSLGLISACGGGWLLPRLVGWQRAAELIFSARTLEPEEALSLGLFLEVLDPEDLPGRARELAASVAAGPPQALRLTKRLMRQGQHLGFHDYLDFAAAAQGMCHNSADHIEAVTAFLEKRPPSFEGH